MSACVCECSVLGGLKGASDLPELELQAFVNCALQVFVCVTCF